MLEEYLVSVGEIEGQTGLDFLTQENYWSSTALLLHGSRVWGSGQQFVHLLRDLEY